MERKINETFQDHGRTLQVVENDDEGRFRWRLGRYCNTNCYIYATAPAMEGKAKLETASQDGEKTTRPFTSSRSTNEPT